MSRNYQQSWEFREQVSRDLYPEDYAEDDGGCLAGCPLETSADSCLALVCPHRGAVAAEGVVREGEIVYRESQFGSSQAICAAAGDHSPAPGEAEPPCPEPGELRVMYGTLFELVVTPLLGPAWVPRGPDPTEGDAA